MTQPFLSIPSLVQFLPIKKADKISKDLADLKCFYYPFTVNSTKRCAEAFTSSIPAEIISCALAGIAL